MVKRVHELYEELGRKDVQAVEELENEERGNSEDEAKTGLKPDANEKHEKEKDIPKDKTDK